MEGGAALTPSESPEPHLLPGCHHPQLHNSILELLLSHNGHKGDARVLAVLQLIQELGVLLVQYFCLEGNQSTRLLSALACCSVPHHPTSIPRPLQLLAREWEVCTDRLTSKGRALQLKSNAEQLRGTWKTLQLLGKHQVIRSSVCQTRTDTCGVPEAQKPYGASLLCWVSWQTACSRSSAQTQVAF